MEAMWKQHLDQVATLISSDYENQKEPMPNYKLVFPRPPTSPTAASSPLPPIPMLAECYPRMLATQPRIFIPALNLFKVRERRIAMAV
jgi:hypothetical protein